MNAEIPFSLDSDFDELQDQDKTVELVGFICSVEIPNVVGEKKYNLFKFGLSNGENKKVMCLIWGKELIEKYQPTVTINKILHIDGAHCKSSKFPFMLEQQGFIPFEIIIQNSTKMTFLGTHEVTVNAPPTVLPREVNFENIVDSEGKISINGFIKTEFAAIASRFQNGTYGCGSITDGVYKITVNVSNFIVPVSFKKGTAVNVIGEVNRNNTAAPLTITCKDSTMITQRQDVEAMTDLQLIRGNRSHKRKVVSA